MKDNKITIHATLDSEVEGFLKILKNKYSVDISKCKVCGTPINRSERKPYTIFEKLAHRLGRKYYEWNVGSFSRNGVVCEKFNCMLKLRDDELRFFE